MIRWNTNRHYSPNGQRIAADKFNAGVVMVDIDRGINYYLPDCPLRGQSIMQRYDNNDRTEPVNSIQHHELIAALEAYAEHAE